jgi:hypothetical protein
MVLCAVCCVLCAVCCVNAVICNDEIAKSLEWYVSKPHAIVGELRGGSMGSHALYQLVEVLVHARVLWCEEVPESEETASDQGSRKKRAKN